MGNKRKRRTRIQRSTKHTPFVYMSTTNDKMQKGRFKDGSLLAVIHDKGIAVYWERKGIRRLLRKEEKKDGEGSSFISCANTCLKCVNFVVITVKSIIQSRGRVGESSFLYHYWYFTSILEARVDPEYSHARFSCARLLIRALATLLKTPNLAPLLIARNYHPLEITVSGVRAFTTVTTSRNCWINRETGEKALI